MKPIHVSLNRKSQIANDSLGELQSALNRNRGECELPIATLTRQTLDLAERELVSGADVWDTSCADGTQILFTREGSRGEQFIIRKMENAS